MSFSTQNNKRQAHPYKADCTKCFGLCCVALPFAESADFAFTKLAGTPCHNLQKNFLCGIHEELRGKGFRGCTVYECFGAGQKVSQITYNGIDWRNNPLSADEMFQVLPIMQQLHEMLYYLTEALAREDTKALHGQLQEALNETERHTLLEPQEILAFDISAHRAIVNSSFVEASRLVRSNAFEQKKRAKVQAIKSDMIGAKLKGANLGGANLRGVFLIAADLRGSDMRKADLIGADLRDASLHGADLSDSLFLTQAQINSANGDEQTKLPPALTIPRHWLKSK